MNFGAILSPYDVRDYRIGVAATAVYPTSYEIPLLPAVKNQGARSTCVAHALSSLVEVHNALQYDNHEKFSTDFIYGTRDVLQYRGEGMYVREALSNLRKYGDCYWKDCPTNSTADDAYEIVAARLGELRDLAYPHRISTYYRCYTPSEIKAALFNHGPVIVSVKMYHNARVIDGVYCWDDNDTFGYHCMLCYGYNEKGWLIQNSWGAHYGDGGRFVLPYNFDLREAWGVSDNIDDPIIIKKRNTPISNFFYKLYNKIVNFFRNKQ